jgi:hypothetical protein
VAESRNRAEDPALARRIPGCLPLPLSHRRLLIAMISSRQEYLPGPLGVAQDRHWLVLLPSGDRWVLREFAGPRSGFNSDAEPRSVIGRVPPGKEAVMAPLSDVTCESHDEIARNPTKRLHHCCRYNRLRNDSNSKRLPSQWVCPNNFEPCSITYRSDNALRARIRPIQGPIFSLSSLEDEMHTHDSLHLVIVLALLAELLIAIEKTLRSIRNVKNRKV